MKQKTKEEMRDGAGQDAAERVRVTDRRRVNFDGTATEATEATEILSDRETASEPNLKPSYVAELELRARAAEQKVADVQLRFEQVRTDLQRETDATRARLNRAADERARQDKANFMMALLPALDNLQLAMSAASANGGSLEALLNGLRGTVSGFENALASVGVERIRSIGEPFDPELHEAVETIPVEPEQDGIVTAEFSHGYKFGERLLRPARVQVGRG